MNVRQLIEELEGYPDDAEVLTEGCDCYGDSYLVAYLGEYEVIIGRKHGDFDYRPPPVRPHPLAVPPSVYERDLSPEEEAEMARDFKVDM